MTNLGKVLLVDDDEVSNFISAHALQIAHVTGQVSVVEDRHEALELIAEEPFDLVLLEANIACVDDFDFLNTLRQLHKITGMTGPTIVIITAWEGKIDKVREAQYSIWSYLSKPLTQEQVSCLISLIAEGAE